MIKVFVYGTLMRGEDNHDLFLSESKFIGYAELAGYGLYNVSSYPGIVPECNEKVKGEVYEVDQQTLARLDWLEDEGELYIRREVEVDTSEGRLKAYAYIWNGNVDGMKKLRYEDQPWSGRKYYRP